jgi:hypothetical protein
LARHFNCDVKQVSAHSAHDDHGDLLARRPARTLVDVWICGPGNTRGQDHPAGSRRPGTGVRGRPAGSAPRRCARRSALRSGQPGSSAAPRRAAAPRRTAEQRTADAARRIDEQACSSLVCPAHRGVPAPTKPAICPSVPVVIHTSPAAMYSGVSGNRDPDHRRPR